MKVSKSYQQAYRCNRVRYREKKQCCAGCLIISPANTTKCEVHRTICAHDHRGKILGVSIDARLAIDQTSAAISTKKRGRGRPADSPGTKVRKAFEKKMLLLF